MKIELNWLDMLGRAFFFLVGILVGLTSLLLAKLAAKRRKVKGRQAAAWAEMHTVIGELSAPKYAGSRQKRNE